MIDAVIAWCESSGLDFEISGNTCTVVLPGEHKLRTTCSLVAGEHSLSVNAFVARHPDENADAVHRWLLERNRRLFGIAYAIDQLGDIYLVGRIPVEAVSEQLLDQVLGAVLSEADGSFNIILELGFRSSIEKEWRWRLSRGESTANLAAFEHLRPEQG
ncbi:MAG TPA: YbjN domain-containing protein [Actinomycetota bacterium]|nr:YbjN domain-containing protein [Actinomycetota bacterium]